MSKDIRSFLITKGNTQNLNDVKVKKTRPITFSDEEDESPCKGTNAKVIDVTKAKDNYSKSRLKKRTISSDEEEEVPNNLKNKKAKLSDKHKINYEEILEEIYDSPAELLRNKPINRAKAQKFTSKKARESKKNSKDSYLEKFIGEDDDFDATLNQLDTSQVEEEYLSSIKSETSSFFKSNDKDAQKKEKEHSSTEVKTKIDKINVFDTKEEEKQENFVESKDKVSPTKNKKEDRNHHEKHNYEKEKDFHLKKSKKGKESKVNTSSTENNDTNFNEIIEEKIEKKKIAAIMYQKYLHRGGARNPGSKEIPQAAENCLANLSFLITGVLESLEREQAEGIIKQYGGKVVHSVSRKLSYIIIGDEPGPSKLTKAESLGIKKLSENDFLDLLRLSPAVDSNAKSSITSDSNIKRKREESSFNKLPSLEKSKKSKEELLSTDKQENPENIKINNKEDLSSKEKYHSSEKTKATEDLAFKVDKEKINACSQKNLKHIKSTVNEEQSSNVKNEIQPSTSSIFNDITNNLQDGVDQLTALVEKYRPTEMKQIIGQTGDKSNANKLYAWLKNWHNIHGKNSKVSKPKTSYRDDSGTIYKAALLSGPPGIGKTTTAYVVCAKLGYEVLEFNASDTRSKKLLQEEISGIISNKTVKSFIDKRPTKQKDPPKHVLLMDEVDGMAGNEDRGGMQELIAFIKSTEIPIICICNDRQSPKIRTLANYTFDLRFQKPRLEQIRAAMMSLCYKEGIKVDSNELTMIIQSTNQDIRQVINHIVVLSANSKSVSNNRIGIKDKMNYKNLRLGPWDVVRKVFSAEEHKTMSIHDKSDLFFHDYNIAPLFVEENYLIVTPNGPKNQVYDKIARCSESLAFGDTIEKNIRSNQAWSLLPVQACFSSVIPGSIMSGFINSQINFPSWLGRNSKTNKFDRLLQDITVHARITTGASKEAINLDYIKLLVDSIVRPLALEGTEGVEKAISVMNQYHLTREDLDSLVEITKWPHTRDPMQSVDSKTKAAFTKAYNKTAMFAGVSTMKKKSSDNTPEDEYDEIDKELSDNDVEDEKIENDKLIKAKASKAKAKATSENKPKETKVKTKKPAKPASRSKK
ncbi:replication factor C subunit 1 [Phymastichus coffea]|uniref:replication factor C subunit 1 n=1 Tax=Phymastichus coffea TaxID=108790 RepID=UPI00273CD636|nr:replication factor C subunit 1 [Phymastichus coffea]